MDDRARNPTLSERASALWRRLSQLALPEAHTPRPMALVVRQRKVIREGRMRLYYQAVLFGDNPFDLERHGQVRSLEEEPVSDLEAWAAGPTVGLRYYVADEAAYASVDEAAEAWEGLGVRVHAPPR